MKFTLFHPRPRGVLRHVLWFLLVSLSVANAILLTWVAPKDGASAPAIAPVEIIRITDEACTQCQGSDSFISALQAQPVTIKKDTTIDSRSWYGKLLIRHYRITKVPTVIVKGDMRNEQLTSFLLYGGGAPGATTLGTIKGGAYVLDYVFPPYRETATGAIRGDFELVRLTDASCAECYDPALHEQALAQLSMKPTKTTTIDVASPEGKALVSQYAIDTVPTIVLRGDVSAFDGFETVWKTVGTIEADGAHVFRSGQDLMGVYRDLKTGALVNKK